ncbi:hypothetical protein HYV86_00450 [Candidatus Woesearchaeota archaeon]|nr:hypothetical protein [Candidatus Woesearchaeota archaeon]
MSTLKTQNAHRAPASSKPTTNTMSHTSMTAPRPVTKPYIAPVTKVTSSVSSTSAPAQPQPKKGKRIAIILVVALLIIALAGLAAYFFTGQFAGQAIKFGSELETEPGSPGDYGLYSQSVEERLEDQTETVLDRAVVLDAVGEFDLVVVGIPTADVYAQTIVVEYDPEFFTINPQSFIDREQQLGLIKDHLMSTLVALESEQIKQRLREYFMTITQQDTMAILVDPENQPGVTYGSKVDTTVTQLPVDYADIVQQHQEFLAQEQRGEDFDADQAGRVAERYENEVYGPLRTLLTQFERATTPQAQLESLVPFNVQQEQGRITLKQTSHLPFVYELYQDPASYLATIALTPLQEGESVVRLVSLHGYNNGEDVFTTPLNQEVTVTIGPALGAEPGACENGNIDDNNACICNQGFYLGEDQNCHSFEACAENGCDAFGSAQCGLEGRESCAIDPINACLFWQSLPCEDGECVDGECVIDNACVVGGAKVVIENIDGRIDVKVLDLSGTGVDNMITLSNGERCSYVSINSQDLQNLRCVTFDEDRNSISTSMDINLINGATLLDDERYTIGLQEDDDGLQFLNVFSQSSELEFSYTSFAPERQADLGIVSSSVFIPLTGENRFLPLDENGNGLEPVVENSYITMIIPACVEQPAVCETSEDCEEGFICSQEGVCEENIPNLAGQVCENDQQCGEGLICNENNVCEAAPIDLGGAAIDSDEDGTLDAVDNCPLITNEDQVDTDADGVGDACLTHDNCGSIGNNCGHGFRCAPALEQASHTACVLANCGGHADCAAGHSCTNGVCQAQQANVQEPQSSGGGGGGGSGGGRRRCVSDWSCTWDICRADLTQVGQCVDKNRCAPAKEETRVCEPCVEAWRCGLWTECSNGLQTRTCVDDHLCATYDSVPDDRRECVMDETGMYVPPSVQERSAYQPPRAAAKAPTLQKPEATSSKSIWTTGKMIAVGIPSFVLLVAVLILLVHHFHHKKQPTYNYDDLKKWVAQEKSMGTSNPDIVKILKENTGWSQEEIEKAFTDLSSKPSASVKPVVASLKP